MNYHLKKWIKWPSFLLSHAAYPVWARLHFLASWTTTIIITSTHTLPRPKTTYLNPLNLDLMPTESHTIHNIRRRHFLRNSSRWMDPSKQLRWTFYRVELITEETYRQLSSNWTSSRYPTITFSPKMHRTIVTAILEQILMRPLIL